MTAELSNDELAWLIGLAGTRRRKREDGVKRMKRHPDQSPAEFEAARAKISAAIAWTRSVEDHLIVMLGDRDPGALPRTHARIRYSELKEANVR